MRSENNAHFDCLLAQKMSAKRYQNWLMYIEIIARQIVTFLDTVQNVFPLIIVDFTTVS